MTAMQMLNYWMDENKGHCSYGTISQKLEALLEEEKAQIIAAYCEGCKDTYGNDEPDPKKPDSFYGQLYYDINYDKTKFRQQKEGSADN